MNGIFMILQLLIETAQFLILEITNGIFYLKFIYILNIN